MLKLITSLCIDILLWFLLYPFLKDYLTEKTSKKVIGFFAYLTVMFILNVLIFGDALSNGQELLNFLWSQFIFYIVLAIYLVLLWRIIKRGSINSAELISVVVIAGFALSYVLYPNFGEFLNDIRPEIIGMCLDVGLVYLIIESSLRNERKRKEKEKEREVYNLYIRNQLDSFLEEIERRYLSLFDTENKELTEAFVKSKAKPIKWHLFESRKNKNGSTVSSGFDNVVGNYAKNEIRNLILIYQSVMPQKLINLVLALDNHLQDIKPLGAYEANNADIRNYTEMKLLNCREYILELKEYREKLANEVINEQKQRKPEKEKRQKEGSGEAQ